MISARLYINIEENHNDVDVQYTSIKTYDDSYDIVSDSLKTNNNDVLSTLNSIEKSKLLCEMNELEFKRLNTEIEQFENKIDELKNTAPQETNNHYGLLLCSEELRKRFVSWFDDNGHKPPSTDLFKEVLLKKTSSLP